MAQLDRLRCDHQLDRNHAAAQIDELGEPARGERRHARPVLDALGLRGARDLERHRLSEQPGLECERLRGPGVLRESALLGHAEGVQSVTEACERRLEELDQALVGRGDRRYQADAHDIERLGERQALVVGGRDDAILGEHRHRVLLGGVQLDGDLALGERQCVSRGAEDRGRAAEAERILQVPGCPGLPEAASRERGAQSPELLDEARVRPGLVDGVVERREVRRERLEVEGGGQRHGVEQRARVGDRERGPGARERVVAQERVSLLGLELDVAEDGGGEVGELHQVALAGRAERPHPWLLVAVQRVDQALGEHGPHARASSGEPVQQAEHRRADDVAGRVGAVGGEVLGDDPPVEAGDLVACQRDALAHADAGREAVHAVPAPHDALDEGPRPCHPLERGRRHLHAGACARDRDHIADIERGAVDDDGCHVGRLY